MNTSTVSLLSSLFEKWCGHSPTEFIPLQPSGSYREYYRLVKGNHSAIGVFHRNDKENQAFISFTKHFLSKGVPVPDILGEDLDQQVYLLSDLGDAALFGMLAENREGENIHQEIIDLYKEALGNLAYVQIKAGQDLDYSACYPRAAFDQQSILWDLNYFKYYFLRLAKIPFDEQLLEEDFRKFADYLMEADHDYFLYRDFQARNIMVHEGNPFFIDYQGGRKGALQYDLASILYQAKADLPDQVREELLSHYLHVAGQWLDIDEPKFRQFYQAYVLVRLIQVMGAYGFRGFFERKPHFLESVPYAVKHLTGLINQIELPLELPELFQALQAITKSEKLKEFVLPQEKNQKLTVRISSFSYKRGLPEDPSGNGGGFIFDCRAIHNPGRYQPYKHLTGRDRDVIDFLKKESEIDQFLNHVYALVDKSVRNYLKRNFTHLSVSFGCTGGQHRSVFCADSLAKHLKRKFNVNIELQHVEQELKNWVN
ncbi:MAG: RNase adapter RapZ [Bacteroidota bacterium]